MPDQRRQLCLHHSDVPDDINRHITITEGGEVGPGGAPTHYEIAVAGVRLPPIVFHVGSAVPEGPNGHTNESLLGVVYDRLEQFQRGPFTCQENQQAMDAIYLAISALKRRAKRLYGARTKAGDL